MNSLKRDFHLFNFGLGKENDNSDFYISSNMGLNLKKYDLLLFTDSKGINLYDDISWTRSIIEHLKEKYSILFISRPKEMTVFFTLINFLKLNNIKFKYLITNIGFVDTTPKKKEFINDIVGQNPFINKVLNKRYLCDYILSSGQIAELYSLNYQNVIEDIATYLSERFEKIFLLGTFVFTPEIKIKRKRPLEFYSQLEEANRLIKSIAKNDDNFVFVDVNKKLSDNQEKLSYDAVHFTEVGHNKVYNMLKENIDL